MAAISVSISATFSEILYQGEYPYGGKALSKIGLEAQNYNYHSLRIGRCMRYIRS